MKVTKADEGVYRCEARVEARGEIDFRDIVVLVNGKPGFYWIPLQRHITFTSH